jgi:hypothetical protein
MLQKHLFYFEYYSLFLVATFLEVIFALQSYTN